LLNFYLFSINKSKTVKTVTKVDVDNNCGIIIMMIKGKEKVYVPTGIQLYVWLIILCIHIKRSVKMLKLACRKARTLGKKNEITSPDLITTDPTYSNVERFVTVLVFFPYLSHSKTLTQSNPTNVIWKLLHICRPRGSWPRKILPRIMIDVIYSIRMIFSLRTRAYGCKPIW